MMTIWKCPKCCSGIAQDDRYIDVKCYRNGCEGTAMYPLTNDYEAVDHQTDAFKYFMQGYMKTKQQKQKEWILEQGYVKDGNVLIVYPTDNYSIRANSHYFIEAHFNYDDLLPVGIFKDGEFIKMPEFSDDAVDESLKGYLLGCTDRKYSLSAVLIEINKRLKDLEAIVLNQTKLEK